jgi:hypothetical protein
MTAVPRLDVGTVDTMIGFATDVEQLYAAMRRRLLGVPLGR